MDEQHHTVRQKSIGIDGGCVDHLKRCIPVVGHTDKKCCEDKFTADHRAIEKEKKYWLLTAQTPSDYESELF